MIIAQWLCHDLIIWCSQHHLLSTAEIEWLCLVHLAKPWWNKFTIQSTRPKVRGVFFSKNEWDPKSKSSQLHRSRWFCSSNPFFVWFTWLIHKLSGFLTFHFLDSSMAKSATVSWQRPQETWGSFGGYHCISHFAAEFPVQLQLEPHAKRVQTLKRT